MPVKVDLITDEEIKANAVRLEVICTEAYYVTETHRDSRGHQVVRTVKRTNELSKIESILAESPLFSAGMQRRWDVSLDLPSNAVPTCARKVVDVKWLVKAVLDVPGRPDQVHELTLQVLAPRAREITMLSSDKRFDDVVMNLQMPSAAAVGKKLSGKLTLSIKEKISLQGIRIELVCYEDAGSKTASEAVVRNEISNSLSFSPGETPTFDFSLQLPEDIPPTSHGSRSSLDWKVKAILDRKMKTDYSLEQEVYIYNETV